MSATQQTLTFLSFLAPTGQSVVLTHNTAKVPRISLNLQIVAQEFPCNLTRLSMFWFENLPGVIQSMLWSASLHAVVRGFGCCDPGISMSRLLLLMQLFL